MRIAYISNSIIPSRYANSIQVIKMCQAFSDNGHEVSLLARFSWSLGNDDYQKYSVRQGFEILKYWRPKNFPKRVRRAIYTAFLRFRVKHLKKRPDLLYGRDIVGLMALCDLGIPIIYEAHGSPRGKDIQDVEGELFKHEKFVRLIVICKALKLEYLDLYPFLSADKIVVAHDGADIMEVDQDCYQHNNKSNHVGYVGQLYPRKGMDIIAELIAKMPEITFHIIGGMPADIKKWKQKFQEHNNVVFYGFIWQSDLPKYYQQFNVVLAPYTYTDYSKWTSPLKIFEYMGYKKTIIASDIPVLKEVLTDRRNALLVPPDNIEQWVECIRLATKDSELRTKLTEYAFQELVTTYNWKERAQKVIAGI